MDQETIGEKFVEDSVHTVLGSTGDPPRQTSEATIQDIDSRECREPQQRHGLAHEQRTTADSQPDKEVGLSTLDAEDIMENLSTTLKINGSCEGHRARILVDSGSSANIVSTSSLKEYNLRAARTQGEIKVKLPDGATVDITGVLPNASLRSGIHREQLALFVVDTNVGADIILGMPWLEKHNPDVDWID